MNYFRFGAISVTCVLQPSATGYALPLYRMQVIIQDMIVMLAKWRWYGDYTQVTFQTRGIKACFILSLVPNVLEKNAVLLQLRTQRSCRLDLLPNDFLLFTHLGLYSDFDITLETLSLQGRHIKEHGDTLSDNTYV